MNGANGIAKLLLVGFLLVGGFFLITEHRAHVFGVLPYLLLLACPLMHLLGHHHGGHSTERPNPPQPMNDHTAHGAGH